MKSMKALLFILTVLMFLGSIFGSADAQKPPTDNLIVGLSTFGGGDFFALERESRPSLIFAYGLRIIDLHGSKN